MLWFSFNFASLLTERKPSIDGQNAVQNENPSSKELFPMHVSLPSVQRPCEKSLAPVFGTIAFMEFVLKNLCQQLCSFSLAPCQRSYARPMAQGLETLTSLGRTVFRNNRIDEICPKKPVPTAVHF